jgi:glycosyltransferase involved in cell wall biosynthesis
MVKIAEYMAAARPIAAFDLIETRRTAGDAAVFAPEESVESLAALVARLAREPDLREALAGRAAERVGALTWERSERALLQAYDRVLERSEPHTKGSVDGKERDRAREGHVGDQGGRVVSAGR